MKKSIFVACATLVVSVGAFTGYHVLQNSQLSDLIIANIDALTDNENNNPNRKLTVCLCTDVDPSNGYYDWSDMENHCHDGIGNDCTGMVYACPYTWYCNL